ncbi:energy transducer TonB [Enterobacteriaceae bacterium LUAb1]
MTTLISTLPRYSPLPMLLSLILHGGVIAGILYASFHQVVEMPKLSQPITFSMVAPEVSSESAAPPPSQPEPVPEPEQPKRALIPLPKPEKKRQPKPVKKERVKAESTAKPAAVKNPVTERQPVPPKPLAESSSPPPATSQGMSSGPRVQRINKPAYPARAFALRIEGRVRVQYDVGSDGRVGNIRILSAKPGNMFEREVKQAMKKWRYEPGKPGQNLTMSIVFRLNGGSRIE